MPLDLISPWMLWGLLGLSLPLLAHLLSKRKYDVVYWGAMQFLELGRNARRKIRLEQFILLMLRMALILLLVLAMARPWTNAGWLTSTISTKKRDVVIIVDGSYSMGWEGQSVTPHQAAIQVANRFLDDLHGGDSVALIDARDEPRLVIENPTHDTNLVRKKLDALPPPAGKADLGLATRRAVQILSSTSNLSREIVVITDRQAKSWRPEDSTLWTTYDDQLQQPAYRPRTWVIEVGEQSAGTRTNFSVSRLELNREVTAIGYPIVARARITSTGGKAPTLRKVYFEVDGQRLEDRTKTVTVSGDADAKGATGVTVDFEYAFDEAGSHRIAVVIEKDSLPGDDRSEAAIVVRPAVPVLLVDGAPNSMAPLASETGFTMSAFNPAGNDAPWVKADVVPWDNLKDKLGNLKQYEAVLLANVPRLTDEQISALSEFVSKGGGLFFALGDKVIKNEYNGKLYKEGKGLLPVAVEKIEEKPKKKNKNDAETTLSIMSGSLEVAWLSTFKLENESDLCRAQFSNRWIVTPAPRQEAGEVKVGDKEILQSDPVIAAKYTTKEPFLVTRKYGHGRVAVMTATLNEKWGTLPDQKDFTPFVHELVFYLSTSTPPRNVEVGSALVLVRPANEDVSNHRFFGPGNTKFEAIPGTVINDRKFYRLNNTTLPGLYTYRRMTDEGKADTDSPAEYFVVNSDRGESDLTPLTDEQREALAKSSTESTKPRMTFAADRKELVTAMFKDNSPWEFWWVLLFAFLGILVFEVVMARKMVQGGHVVDDFAAEPSSGQGPPPIQGQAKHGAPPPLPRGRSRGVVSLGEKDFVEDYDSAPASARRR